MFSLHHREEGHNHNESLRAPRVSLPLELPFDLRPSDSAITMSFTWPAFDAPPDRLVDGGRLTRCVSAGRHGT